MQPTTRDHSYTAVRRERTLPVSFERFAQALESLLGRMHIAALSDVRTMSPEHARETLASFVGPSGFTLFQRLDHGSLVTALAGRTAHATTYVLGNALIAIEMTRHAPLVGLYVPPRLFAQETPEGHLLVTYDLPSATVGQFGSPEADAVAASLDAKLEKLIDDAATLAAGEPPIQPA